MTKAEQAALLAYPKKYTKAEFPDGQTVEFEGHEREIDIYLEGYRAAQQEIINYIKKCITVTLSGKQVYCVDVQALKKVLEE